MSLPVLLRSGADRDIQEAYDELEMVQSGLGIRFIVGVRDVLERIESMPEMYGAVWNGVRAARLKHFRHIVYYIVLSDRVEVLAVIHGSRDASVWQSRT